MTRKFALLRYILFCVFFAIGTSAAILAILVPELMDFSNSTIALKKLEASNEEAKSLSDQYDSRIEYIQESPEALERIKRLTLRQQPDSIDTAYPQPSQEYLDAALDAILEDLPSGQPVAVPEWIKRCSKPASRFALFFAGAGLILIAFACFNTKPGATPKS